MSENWLTWNVSGTIAGVGVIGSHLGILYLAEHHHDKAEAEYIRFATLRKTLRGLEKEIDVEAWCWPIYARPVYYTPIDRDAQVLFSNVQRNLSRVIELERQTPPPPPRMRTLRRLLAFKYNWQVYNTSLEIQQNIAEFDDVLKQMSTQLNILRNSHEREVTLQGETQKSLEALEKQIAETGKKIRKKSQGKKYDENLNWVQTNTNNCYIEAQNQLQKKTNDGINYAVADLYILIAKYMLEHFDLYEKEYSIPARFELDQFEHHHDEFRKWVELILAEEIVDWATLHKTATYRQLVDQQMNRSILSLKGFLGKQKVFNELEKQIHTLNFTKIQKEVQDVEKECERYWRPYDQDPSIWVRALKSDSLPSIDMDDARRLHQADIFPATGPDAVIKQSSMIKIISDSNLFIRKIAIARSNHTKLGQELRVHKAAQLEVEIRLGVTGRTYQRIKELASIESDSSPDIQRKCISSRTNFDVFQTRTRAVQGANFPKMLEELDEFEKSCAEIKQQHTSQVEGLKRQWHELIQQLISLQSEINEYVSRRPRIEYDVSEISNKIQLAINSYSPEVESYRDLNTYISQTKPMIGGAKKDKMQLEKFWKQFLVAQDKAEKILLEMKKALDDFQESSQQSWVWTQKAYTRALTAARNSYQRRSRELEQVAKMDIVIKNAIGLYQRIQEEVTVDLQNAVARLEPIQEQQEHLQNQLSDLMDKTRRTTMFSITPKNSDLIRQFCSMALLAENEDSARINLDLAQKVLERSLPREEAVKIINNQGVYNENQNVEPGGIANNAGRDINLPRSQPTIG